MSVAIKTGSGADASISTTTLPDGTIAVNHVVVNAATGASILPAQDATLQAATTALQSLASTLGGLVKTDPGTF